MTKFLGVPFKGILLYVGKTKGTPILGNAHVFFVILQEWTVRLPALLGFRV